MSTTTAFELVRQSMAMEMRGAIRFPIRTAVEYRTLNGGAAMRGCGQTINISSNGILFESDTSPVVGQHLELRVTWPVRTANGPHVALVAIGRVIRVEDRRIAFAIGRYSFCADGAEPADFQSAIAG